MVIILFVIFILISGISYSNEITPAKISTLDKFLLKSQSLTPFSNCNELKNYLVKSFVKQNFRMHDTYKHCSNGKWVDPSTVFSPEADKNNWFKKNKAKNIITAKTTIAKLKENNLDLFTSHNQSMVSPTSENNLIEIDYNGVTYIVSGKYLIIVKKVNSKKTSVVKTLYFGNYAASVFLDREKQRLMIISPYVDTGDEPSKNEVVPATVEGETDVIFFDVSSADNPVLLKQVSFDSDYISAQLINSRLHLLLSKHANMFKATSNYISQFQLKLKDITEQLKCKLSNAEDDYSVTKKELNTILNHPDAVALKNELSQYINKVIKNVPFKGYLPVRFESDGKSKQKKYPLLSCTDVLHTNNDYGTNIEFIASIDSDGNNSEGVGLFYSPMRSFGAHYISNNKVYISKYILESAQKTPDIKYPTDKTMIHKFILSKTKAIYSASGIVDGVLYASNKNFNEYKDNLQIITDQFDIEDVQNTNPDIDLDVFQKRTDSNNLFILRDNKKGSLVTIGSVSGFAKDTPGLTSHFLGGKAIMVPARSDLPIFTLDLSNPYQPKLMGNFIYPEFSSFVKQYDENHVITIGSTMHYRNKSGKWNMQLGFQLVDISDLSKIKPIHSYVHDYAEQGSSNLDRYDPQSFLFYKPANLLILPISYKQNNKDSYFSGFSALHVSIKDGFKVIGGINHNDLKIEVDCSKLLGTNLPAQHECNPNANSNSGMQRRALIQYKNNNALLYTLSDLGLKINSVSNINKSIDEVSFPYQSFMFYRLVGFAKMMRW